MDIEDFFRKYPELRDFFLIIKEEFNKAKRPPEETILDDVDLQGMLKVSERTTSTWRTERIIKHTKRKGKIFYKLSWVLDFIEYYSIEPITKELKIRL